MFDAFRFYPGFELLLISRTVICREILLVSLLQQILEKKQDTVPNYTVIAHNSPTFIRLVL